MAVTLDPERSLLVSCIRSDEGAAAEVSSKDLLAKLLRNMEIDGGLEANNGDSGDFDATLLHAIAASMGLRLGAGGAAGGGSAGGSVSSSKSSANGGGVDTFSYNIKVLRAVPIYCSIFFGIWGRGFSTWYSCFY
jgi:hypothetical protein